MRNCKAGDLAVVIDRYSSNRDKLLRVLDVQQCDFGEWRCQALQQFDVYQGEKLVGQVAAGAIVWGEDRRLRPIRDQDGPDESLEWAGLPKTKEREHA